MVERVRCVTDASNVRVVHTPVHTSDRGLVESTGISDCREPAADFRGTFGRRSADDRLTLEELTAWAEQLCSKGVVELTFGKSPAGRDRSLALGPPGEAALLHIVNSDSRSHVNVYSYSYARLGRDRFLKERLGGSRTARAALARAENFAEREKLWMTNFSPATLDALRDLLVVARDHAP
jgi:hypothetical protein